MCQERRVGVSALMKLKINDCATSMLNPIRAFSIPRKTRTQIRVNAASFGLDCFQQQPPGIV